MSSTINQLTQNPTVTASDQFAIWDTNNGNTRKVSATALATYVNGQFAGTSDVATQPYDGGNTLLGYQTTTDPKTFSLANLGAWFLQVFTGFTQSGTGAVARTQQAKSRDIVDIRDFGGGPSATAAANVAAFTAAQAALPANGGVINLPAGDIQVNAAVTITKSGVTIRGEGFATRILTTSLTGDVFQLGDGSNEISGVRFEGLRVWATLAKSGGYAFNCRFATNTEFVNVRAGSIDDYTAAGNAHRLWDGWFFDRFAQIVIDQGETVVANDALKCRGNADQSFGAEISIDGGHRIFKAGGKGVWMGGGAGGVYLGRMDISECRYGVYCDDTLTAGTNNRELFLAADCTIDNNVGWGIYIRSNGLALLEASNPWISGNGIAGSEGGIRVDATTGVDVSAKWACLRLQNSKYDGVSLASGSHTFNGGFCRSNGVGAGGGNGFTLTGFSALVINGMNIHDNGSGARSTGISLGAGLTTFNIQGNNLFSHAVANLTNASGVGTNRIICENVGVVSENIGSATVLNGTGSLVVNHGLYAVPSAVIFCNAGPTGGDVAHIAPGSYTATQFTITMDAPATGNRDYVWRAVVGVQ